MLGFFCSSTCLSNTADIQETKHHISLLQTSYVTRNSPFKKVFEPFKRSEFGMMVLPLSLQVCTKASNSGSICLFYQEPMKVQRSQKARSAVHYL